LDRCPIEERYRFDETRLDKRAPIQTERCEGEN